VSKRGRGKPKSSKTSKTDKTGLGKTKTASSRKGDKDKEKDRDRDRDREKQKAKKRKEKTPVKSKDADKGSKKSTKRSSKAGDSGKSKVAKATSGAKDSTGTSGKKLTSARSSSSSGGRRSSRKDARQSSDSQSASASRSPPSSKPPTPPSPHPSEPLSKETRPRSRNGDREAGSPHRRPKPPRESADPNASRPESSAASAGADLESASEPKRRRKSGWDEMPVVIPGMAEQGGSKAGYAEQMNLSGASTPMGGQGLPGAPFGMASGLPTQWVGPPRVLPNQGKQSGRLVLPPHMQMQMQGTSTLPSLGMDGSLGSPFALGSGMPDSIADAGQTDQLALANQQQQQGMPRSTMIDQRWVGYIIGQGGETLRHIRDSCGVAIQIDQSTKDEGFSIVQIFGPPSVADTALMMINAKIAEVDPQQRPHGEVEEIKVDQNNVGYILGKGGETLRAIRQESGANLSIDQSTKEMGFSVVKIVGSEQAKKHAAELVNTKMAELRSGRSHAAEYRVEQAFVGWLIGKGGETVKTIKEQSGANVVIDQSTKDHGFSTVRVLQGPGSEMAREMIEVKLREVQASKTSFEEMRVDQKWVGWLIGRGGETVRYIKDHSGASVVINQNTKEMGFSILRLGGTLEAISMAQQMIEQKLIEVQQAKGELELQQLTAAQRSAGLEVPLRSMGVVPPPMGAVPPPSCMGAVPPPTSLYKELLPPMIAGATSPLTCGDLGQGLEPRVDAEPYDPFADISACGL